MSKRKQKKEMDSLIGIDRIMELERMREMIESERERELNKKERGEDYNHNFEGIKIRALTREDLEIYEKLKKGILKKEEYEKYKKEIDKLKKKDSRKYFLSYVGNRFSVFLMNKK